MRRVDFEYDVGDRVSVVHAGNIDGHVTALKLEACGQQYRVAWWQDGRRMEDWLLAWELKGVPQTRTRIQSML